MTAPRIPLQGQIAEVRRELDQRVAVYQNLVSRNKMRQSEADYRTAAMTAVLNTLLWLQRHQAEVVSVAASNAVAPHPETRG